MKKLLVTAIGAAVAFGAFAGQISTQRFEGEETGDKLVAQLPGGANYWSEPAGSTNTYTVGAAGTVNCPLPFADDEQPSPTQALGIKTTFGKPLSVNLVSGGTATNIPNSGIYFDSLVKFTVCEDTPTETYDGAKIIMWLQEQYDSSENVIGTNLVVRAGYLSYNANAESPVSVTPSNYVCTLGTSMTGDFADKWHRVTIKAIPDITTGAGVPGFAIYIDGSGSELLADVNSTQAKWDNSFTLALNEGAKWLNDEKCLFPSMVQNGDAKGSLTSASFDGTGSITDIVFTDEPMAFAADYVAPKASVTIGNVTTDYSSLAAAVDAVNAVASGTTVTFQLSKGLVLDEPLSFASSANLILDFAGNVLTNLDDSAAAISNEGILTITNSVGNGGVLSNVALVDDGNGSLTITGGSFWGTVTLNADGTYSISGGSFLDDTDLEMEGCLAAGKRVVYNSETGLFDVVDATYTVTYVYGLNGASTNTTSNLAKDAETPLAPDAAVAGYIYVWSPVPASTVSADATYTAVYTPVDYTITYLNEDGTEFTEWADYLPTRSYTITNAVALPTASNVQLVDVGVEFGGWTNETGTVTGWAAGEQTGNVTVYAKLDPVVPASYTITYLNEDGTTFTNWVAAFEAPASYTTAQTVTLPTSENVDLTGVLGVTFGGWTNETGTVTGWAAGEQTGNVTVYAKLNPVSGPAPIDPTAVTPTTVVAAESQADAISRAEVTAPTGVDAAAYKSNFDFSATSNGDGTYTVTLTGIKEEVKADVCEDAVAVLTSASGTGSVEVPAGLYYRITRYTAIGTAVSETPATGQSNGSVSVSKPGETQGFIKVEMSTVPFAVPNP